MPQYGGRCGWSGGGDDRSAAKARSANGGGNDAMGVGDDDAKSHGLHARRCASRPRAMECGEPRGNELLNEWHADNVYKHEPTAILVSGLLPLRWHPAHGLLPPQPQAGASASAQHAGGCPAHPSRVVPACGPSSGRHGRVGRLPGPLSPSAWPTARASIRRGNRLNAKPRTAPSPLRAGLSYALAPPVGRMRPPRESACAALGPRDRPSKPPLTPYVGPEPPPRPPPRSDVAESLLDACWD